MEVFVARQAVLDRNRRVYGYELLFRSSAEPNQFDGTEASLATTQVLANSVLAIGLESLLGRKKAFVNFGRGLLLADLRTALPPESTVIEVLETVEPDAEVIAACVRLREQGYRIALDDFVVRPEYEPLLSLANLVKVEIKSVSRHEQEALIRHCHSRGLEVVAEKVETHEEFEWARKAGYDYFQGYFFARPVVMRAQQIPTVKLNCLRLLQEVQRPDLNLDRLEALISEDVSLSYKLLRYVNSALFSHPGRIQSIRHAIRFLGENNLRKWIPLAAIPRAAEDKPAELVTHSLVRARFCESIGAHMKAARQNGAHAGEAAFLMGLFSLLDALIDRPLPEALAEVNLAPYITAALLGTAPEGDPLGIVYGLARNYEIAEWTSVERLTQQAGLPASTVSQAYYDAVQWASQILQAAK
jgi:c-di-GMP-related signal transduction protein